MPVAINGAQLSKRVIQRNVVADEINRLTDALKAISTGGGKGGPGGGGGGPGKAGGGGPGGIPGLGMIPGIGGGIPGMGGGRGPGFGGLV